MRATCWARWATCALAISICVPALADRARRSVATCTSFDQADQADSKVAFTIRNTCSMPVDCAVSWRVVCAPEAKRRRTAHPGSVRLAVEHAGSQSAEASAAVCGDDSWVIDSVTWSCAANKD
jgi:hypothetical protein